MATAEELLGNELGDINNLWFEIDLLARQIVIPKAVTNLGARGDEDVMHACFRLPRFYYDIDFADFKIGIDYTNAQGEEDRYEPKDVVIDDDVVTFTWVVGRHAALYEGTVTFGQCAKRLNPDDPNDPLNEFHTRKTSLPILDSMETCEEAIVMHTDLLEQWRRELFDREESVAAAEAIVSYSTPTDPEVKIWINPSGTAGVAATSTESKNISSVSNIVGLALNEMLNNTAARYATIQDAHDGASATADGKVLAYTCGGALNIMLLDNIESASVINIAKDCTLHLNGKTLSFTAPGAYLNITTASEVTINGEVAGSEITKNISNGANEKLVSATGTTLNMVGGTYSVYGTYTTAAMCVRTENASTNITMYGCTVIAEVSVGNSVRCTQFYGNSTIDHCTFTAINKADKASGATMGIATVRGCDKFTLRKSTIVAKSDGTANAQAVGALANTNVVEDCDIYALSMGLRTNVYGYFCTNDITVTNCHIEADGWSDTENEDGVPTPYPAYPISCDADSHITINGGYYWGARDAFATHGSARINGGVFEGCQHGGAYMSGSDIKAKNAIFRNVEYKGTVGWLEGQNHGGAIYCGSPTNNDVNVYFDNCRFESSAYAISGVVAKNTGTEVFLSNCVIDGDFTYDLRADAGNTIYIGKNVEYDTVAENGGTIDAATYADQEFGFETETTTSHALLSVKDERGNWVSISSSFGGNMPGFAPNASKLVDRATGIEYTLYVEDGKLKMEVAQ